MLNISPFDMVPRCGGRIDSRYGDYRTAAGYRRRKIFRHILSGSPDHRPCVKSEEGCCFAKWLSKSELLDAVREAEIWLKYTPLDELAGKAFVSVIRRSTHDRLFRS